MCVAPPELWSFSYVASTNISLLRSSIHFFRARLPIFRSSGAPFIFFGRVYQYFTPPELHSFFSGASTNISLLRSSIHFFCGYQYFAPDGALFIFFRLVYQYFALSELNLVWRNSNPPTLPIRK